MVLSIISSVSVAIVFPKHNRVQQPHTASAPTVAWRPAVAFLRGEGRSAGFSKTLNQYAYQNQHLVCTKDIRLAFGSNTPHEKRRCCCAGAAPGREQHGRPAWLVHLSLKKTARSGAVGSHTSNGASEHRAEMVSCTGRSRRSALQVSAVVLELRARSAE